MLVPLAEAVAATCGGKAAALGAMLRAGLPVPDGFVVPFAVHREATADGPLPEPLLEALERGLEHLGASRVAVRSSAADEDTDRASAAGQHDSVLAVEGIAGVADALRTCWASLDSSRAVAYRNQTGGLSPRHPRARGQRPASAGEPAMAVVVQHHLDADVSGVMFTPPDPDGDTLLECSWGLGPSVVAGTVSPDTYRVHPDGAVTGVVADKRTRLDRAGTRLVTRDVPVEQRRRATLDEATARAVATLGGEVAGIPDGPRPPLDLEWAVADGRVWLLQARPVTAPLPPSTPSPTRFPMAAPATLTGTPGSAGAATGTARTVRGPRDFPRVRPGDVLVCPFTDPAWTPLLSLAAGVVTETGGVLSHAAIVARERGIPAVLGVADAMTSVRDGVTVTVDGTAGTVTVPGP